jgi:LPXTG-motif cell wall-anchored protein
MDVTTLVIIGGAIVFGALYLLRRRSRMRSDKFD